MSTENVVVATFIGVILLLALSVIIVALLNVFGKDRK